MITGKTEVWHISDYESDEPIYVKQFMETMDNMKVAKGLGKQISYQFGYSNLTFDLWIILHKADCNGAIAHRKNYLTLQQYKGYSYYKENPSIAVWEVIEKN